MSLKLKLLLPKRFAVFCRDLPDSRSLRQPQAGGSGGGCIAASGDDSILDQAIQLNVSIDSCTAVGLARRVSGRCWKAGCTTESADTISIRWKDCFLSISSRKVRQNRLTGKTVGGEGECQAVVLMARWIRAFSRCWCGRSTRRAMARTRGTTGGSRDQQQDVEGVFWGRRRQ
jgi:hypothetical protein